MKYDGDIDPKCPRMKAVGATGKLTWYKDYNNVLRSHYVHVSTHMHTKLLMIQGLFWIKKKKIRAVWNFGENKIHSQCISVCLLDLVGASGNIFWTQWPAFLLQSFLKYLWCQTMFWQQTDITWSAARWSLQLRLSCSAVLAIKKIGIKKTDGRRWSWTNTLWLLSGHEGTIRRASALQSIVSLANGCFLISNYGIIGVVGERQQPYFLLKWPAMIQHPPGLENSEAANELPVNILTFHWQKGLVFQGPGAKHPDFKK